MDDDIFKRFDRFIRNFSTPSADGGLTIRSSSVHPDLDWISDGLWVAGGCLLLHEKGKDG